MKYVYPESSGWSDRATAYLTSGVDAIVVVAYLVVVDLATVGGLFPPAARAAVALPLAIFLPGYALVTALFPRTTASFLDGDPRDPFAGAVDGALSPTERVALSFGTTLAVVPLVGLAHSVAGLGFRPSALLGTLNTVVVVGLVVGVVRRVRTPRSDRVAFSPRSWSTTLGTVFERRSRAEVVLTAAVLAAVIVATGSLGFALLAPADGESYTTVALLTENESGSLVMDGYPETLASESSVVVGVTNHEGERTTYTVVTELQAVDAANGSSAVRADRELARTNRTVPAGDTWYADQSIGPVPGAELPGDRLRVRFFLYHGGAPADPAVGTADDYVDLSLSNASSQPGG